MQDSQDKQHKLLMTDHKNSNNLSKDDKKEVMIPCTNNKIVKVSDEVGVTQSYSYEYGGKIYYHYTSTRINSNGISISLSYVDRGDAPCSWRKHFHS
jgi:hypothetical protein